MRQETESSGIGPWLWPLLVAGLLLAYLSVRNAVQAISADSRPELAVRFWPADGVSLSNLALNRVAAAGGTVDPASAALARRSLLRSPRAATPLVIAGLDASATGDLGRAQALMEAARARQPRTETARFWLLDHYMRTGNYAAGLGEIAPAMAMRGEAGVPLMNLLGGLATIPTARRALLDKLAKQPVWRAYFFQQEANAPLPPGTILSLLEALPPTRDPVAARAEQRAVIDTMVARGAYAEAYGAWQSFLPQADRPAAGAVYDPDFRGLPGSEPFAWHLETADDIGVARTAIPGAAEGSGLQIDYRGTTPQPVASETIPVIAGDYRLSAKARRVDSDAPAGRITLSATCTTGGNALATLPLDPLTPQWHAFEIALSVPPTCPAILLHLAGEPGEAFGDMTAQVTAIGLARR